MQRASCVGVAPGRYRCAMRCYGVGEKRQNICFLSFAPLSDFVLSLDLGSGFEIIEEAIA